MGDLIELNNEYFEQSNIALAPRFSPFFTISVCSHMVNLANQKMEFAISQNKVANLRVHLFMCAPPGHMKTVLLRSYLDGPSSICGLGNLDVQFEGAMTEAGFTGTIKYIDGEPHTVKGAAFEHREGIVGIDEFAVLSNAMKQEHSVNLDNAMLTALDSGFLIKRLALGKIQYITQMTLMTGSQPSRFSLTSGLGRRFVFVYFVPSSEDSRRIKIARRQGRNSVVREHTKQEISDTLRTIVESSMEIDDVRIDKSVYDILDVLKVPHYEEELYERLAIGYQVAKMGVCEDVIVAKMDSRLRNIFRLEHEWRSKIQEGADVAQVWTVVQEMDGCGLSEVKHRLTNIGLTWNDSGEKLNTLRRQGRIDIVRAEQEGKGRPKQIVVVTDE